MTTDYILQRQEDLRKLKKLERQAEKLKAAWNAKEALDEENASKARIAAKEARMRGEKPVAIKSPEKPVIESAVAPAVGIVVEQKKPKAKVTAKKKSAPKKKPTRSKK
ncbi:MAG TPA: hypothetical protein DCL66_01690 [Gammaproteobacteria bacterium]|nr:hypothetical protein [Gammaproteobacteria bacterium]|tara:strand:+ start:191 stop:514 length:324 start_codon:yes stop_codon:yes gene_type:complete